MPVDKTAPDNRIVVASLDPDSPNPDNQVAVDNLAPGIQVAGGRTFGSQAVGYPKTDSQVDYIQAAGNPAVESLAVGNQAAENPNRNLAKPDPPVHRVGKVQSLQLAAHWDHAVIPPRNTSSFENALPQSITLHRAHCIIQGTAARTRHPIGKIHPTALTALSGRKSLVQAQPKLPKSRLEDTFFWPFLWAQA